MIDRLWNLRKAVGVVQGFAKLRIES